MDVVDGVAAREFHAWDAAGAVAHGVHGAAAVEVLTAELQDAHHLPVPVKDSRNLVHVRRVGVEVVAFNAGV